MQNYLDLSDKVALITGASSGIGAATAEVFAELGAKVAIGYNHNERGARQIRDKVIQASGRSISIQADVRKDIERMVKQTTDQLGRVDILVNNAGSLIERSSLMSFLSPDGMAEGLGQGLTQRQKAA